MRACNNKWEAMRVIILASIHIHVPVSSRVGLSRSKEVVKERLVGRVGLLGLFGVLLLQALLLDCIKSTWLISA